MHRIVILRALKLGDFLTGVPAYRAIRRAYPGSYIQLAAPRVLAPLSQLLDGAIDEVCDTGELEPLHPRLHGADIGIDMHGKGPASQRLLLQAKPKRLIAFQNAEVPETRDGAEHDPNEHEVARWCRMLQHAGIPADPDDIIVRPPSATTLSESVRNATLLHAGASSPARCWPIERWVDVATAERDAGHDVIITGSDAEAPNARAIARAAGIPASHMFAGRTSLIELAELVNASSRVVCGDTGIAHLASAFERPSVVLFGPTPPAHWGPPARPIHRVLWSGGRGDPHAQHVDAGLLSISSTEVIEALRTLPETVAC